MKNALIIPAALLSTALILSACSNATDAADTSSSAVVQVDATPVSAEMAPVESAMTDATTEDMAMVTKTKAVLLYADWCSSCKTLDPKIKAVQAMGTMPGLDFVTLDYTAKNADDFYAQAAAAGVEAAVRTELDGTIKTGWLLLVDMDDARVIGKVTKSDSPADIATKLKDALAAS